MFETDGEGGGGGGRGGGRNVSSVDLKPVLDMDSDGMRSYPPPHPPSLLVLLTLLLFSSSSPSFSSPPPQPPSLLRFVSIRCSAREHKATATGLHAEDEGEESSLIFFHQLLR
eukprot:754636-Hanusia_phi.AAC.1